MVDITTTGGKLGASDRGRGYVHQFPKPKKGDTAPKIPQKTKKTPFLGSSEQKAKGKGIPLPGQTVGVQWFEGSRQR